MLDSRLSQISEYPLLCRLPNADRRRGEDRPHLSHLTEACKARGVPFHPAQREQRQENVYTKKSSNVKADSDTRQTAVGAEGRTQVINKLSTSGSKGGAIRPRCQIANEQKYFKQPGLKYTSFLGVGEGSIN